MSSFLLKIFMCPIAVIVSAWLFTNVEYARYSQAIIVGLTLAVVGTMMEYFILRRGTLWLSTFMDFVAALFIVYFVSNWFEGALVTFGGAALVALLLGAIEHITHLWLIRNGKTRKSHA